jgi:hypothetical protein
VSPAEVEQAGLRAQLHAVEEVEAPQQPARRLQDLQELHQLLLQ